MDDDLGRLASTIAYEPTGIANIKLHLATVTNLATTFAQEMGMASELIAPRLSHADVAATLESSYECIRLLVGSELDTAAPSDRGLGRVTASVPRFGATFRELNDSDAKRVGQVMETICIHGFGAAAVYDAFATPGGTDLQQRDSGELAAQWVRRCIGTEGWNNSVWALIDACAGPPMIQLNSIVTELGLARGLRGKKKLESAESSALILAAGGFNLFAAHSPRNDSWFSDQAPTTVNEGTAGAGATHRSAPSSRPCPSSGQNSNRHSTSSDEVPEAVNEGTARNGATGNYSEVLYGTEDWSQSELRAILAQLEERAVEARMEEGDLVVSIRAESVCDRIVADVTGVSPSDD